VSANYSNAAFTFGAGYQDHYGTKTWSSQFGYNSSVEGLFASGSAGKDEFGNMLAKAGFAKHWSDDNWLAVYAGRVVFGNQQTPTAHFATMEYSAMSNLFLQSRIIGSMTFENGQFDYEAAAAFQGISTSKATLELKLGVLKDQTGNWLGARLTYGY
jgi:hypothetical protein